MNKVELMGRLTKDVELLHTKSDAKVARITLAVARKGSKDAVDFIDCVAFGKLVDILPKYVEKGNRIIVTGSLNLNNYTDKDGKTKTSVNVVMDDFYFVDYKSNRQEEMNLPQ